MGVRSNWAVAIAAVVALTSLGSVRANTITLTLDNAQAGISPAGFGISYSGVLTVSINSSTSLTVGNGSSATSFGVSLAPDHLANADTIGSLGFNNGNLTAGALAFAVTNGSLTDQIVVDYNAQLNAISSLGSDYTFSTKVSAVTMPGSFGGVDLSGFDALAAGALDNSNLVFVIKNQASAADAVVTLKGLGSFGNSADAFQRLASRVPLRLSDGSDTSFSLTPTGGLVPAGDITVPLPAAAPLGLALLGILGVWRGARRLKSRD